MFPAWGEVRTLNTTHSLITLLTPSPRPNSLHNIPLSRASQVSDQLLHHPVYWNRMTFLGWCAYGTTSSRGKESRWVCPIRRYLELNPLRSGEDLDNRHAEEAAHGPEHRPVRLTSLCSTLTCHIGNTAHVSSRSNPTATSTRPKVNRTGDLRARCRESTTQ